MRDRLCLLAVHAHPDDEASKGAGTIARYHAEGVHTVLVTATGGEEGEILNPALDTAEVRADIGAIRRRELDGRSRRDRLRRGRAARLPGLGDGRHAGERRSALLRPGAARRGGRSARRRDPPGPPAGDRDLSRRAEPATGTPTTSGCTRSPSSRSTPPVTPRPSRSPARPTSPRSSTSRCGRSSRRCARHEKFLELGIDSPYAEWFEDGWPNRVSEVAPTARIDVREYYDARRGRPARPRDPDRPVVAVLVRAARGRRPRPLRGRRLRVRPQPRRADRRGGRPVRRDQGERHGLRG